MLVGLTQQGSSDRTSQSLCCLVGIHLPDGSRGIGVERCFVTAGERAEHPEQPRQVPGLFILGQPAVLAETTGWHACQTDRGSTSSVPSP